MVKDSKGVERSTSGVRAPEPPARRWDPGARYRPSLLARDAAAALAESVAVGVPVGVTPVGATARQRPWTLPGRLFRGPAARKPVFERPVWTPGATGHPRAPELKARSADELAEAVERYRRGALNTTGLVRAVGHALAA